ncbi:MAG: DUF4230 domain-containing protein [Lachnospiraceae bacterium]|nr:DUF4230 domain-containing protein [Lachnospiraceae bacterium]
MEDKRSIPKLHNIATAIKLWIAILFEAVIIILLCWFAIHQHKEIVKKEEEEIFVGENISAAVDLSLITNELRTMGELTTVEYLYTDAGKFTDLKQIKGIDIPLTTKSFLIKWNGVIKAGLDVTEIKIYTEENAKTIVVQIPQAEILSHEIDNDSLETLDEHNNIFNKITVDDVNSFIGESKKFMEQRAI